MRRRSGATQVAVPRPMAALISAALLLLTVVAGVGGAGGLAVLGQSSAAPLASGGASATPVVPVRDLLTASRIGVPGSSDRRAAAALGTLSSQQQKAGWTPHHPEASDVPAAAWQPPSDLVDAAVEAQPAVIALTIQVSHRGRAPPAGSLQI